MVYDKLKIVVGPDDWVAVRAPIDCNHFALNNRGPSRLLIRTIIDDDSSQDFIDPGVQEVVNSPLGRLGRIRFPQNSVVCFLKLDGGNPQIVNGTFLN